MTKLDSFAVVLDWLKEVLTAIVDGIQGTFAYWDHRKDELEDLAE